MIANVAILGLLLLLGLVVFGLDAAGFGPDVGEGPDGDGDAGGASEAAAWFQVIFNFTAFGIVPFAWLLGTRVSPWRGALAYLQLHRPWRSLAIGTGLTGYLLVGVLLFLLVIGVLGLTPEGDAEETLALSWPLVIAVSLGAGIGEEVFFRGVAQKYVGVWGQAVFFGLFHAANGWLGITVTFAIGLVFGLLVRRGWSLWTVIAAHTCYDLFLLGWARAAA